MRTVPGSISFAAVTETLGWPRGQIANNAQHRAYLNGRKEEIGLAVSCPILHPGRNEALQSNRPLLEAFVHDLRSRGRPLPASSKWPKRVDHEAIHNLAGLNGDCRKLGWYQRAISEAKLQFGVHPVHIPQEAGVTWDDWVQELPRWLQDHSDLKSTENTLSSVRRLQIFYRAEVNDVVSDDILRMDDDDLIQAAESGRPLKGRSVANFMRQTRYALSCLAVLKQADGLPNLLTDAFDELLNRSSFTSVELACEVGLNDKDIQHLRRSTGPLPRRLVDALPALASALGVPAEVLTSRALASRRRRYKQGSAYFRSLNSEVRGLLPPDAELLSDDEIEEMVVLLEDHVLRQNSEYSAILRHAHAADSLEPLPESAPIIDEFSDLVVLRERGITTGKLKGRPGQRWSESASAIWRTQVHTFARWCVTSRERGGLGLPSENVSMVLFLRQKVVLAFLNFMAGRHIGVEFEGNVRGARLTAMQVQFVVLIKGLLHRRYGFISQQKKRFRKFLVVIEDRLPDVVHLAGLAADTYRRKEEGGELAAERSRANREMIDQTIGGSAGRIMPAKVVSRLRVEWATSLADLREDYADLAISLDPLMRQSRDPFAPIMKILEAAKPLQLILQCVEVARAHLPCSLKQPLKHAAAVRDLVLILLLAFTALRSKNLRQLTYRSDQKGEISFFSEDGSDDERVKVWIGWQNFKNLGSKALLGASGSKHDYVRVIGDWSNFSDLLQYYVDTCRPVLMDAARRRCGKTDRTSQMSDALLLTEAGKPFNTNTLNKAVRRWTGRFIAMDPVTKAVRPGYTCFGVHAFRDIVATHVVRVSKSPLRFEWAADLIMTSVELIHSRYAFRLMEERTSAADALFDDVAGIGRPMGPVLVS